MLTSWPVFTIGLVLFGDEIEELAEAMKEDGCETSDIYELESVIQNGTLYESDDCDGMTFRSFEKKPTEYRNIGGNALVIRAKHQLDPFQPAYPNLDEMVKEFKKEWRKYLPRDFNYRSHIGQFSCAVWSND